MADVKVTIDGIEVTVPKGTFVIEAARRAGIFISNFCYHPDMRPFGACRMCTVGVMGKRGMGLEISCSAECKDGMVVYTENTNDEVRDVKNFVMESLLVDHPLDCPICPASGACDLQNATWHYGMTENRMAREKGWFEQDYLSPAIMIKRDRCVLCGRCVRVCDELVGAHALAFVNRGIETYIDAAWGSDLTKSPCTSCGLCVEVCPVGCLMHVQYENTGLQWVLKRTSTTCNYCGVGCAMNMEAEANTGLLDKVVFSQQVGPNDGRSCVKGRYGYQYANSPDRLVVPLMRKGDEFKEITWEQAYDEIAKRLGQPEFKGAAFGALGSAKCTNEENYLLQKLTRGIMASNNIDNPFRLTQAATLTALTEQLGLAGMTNTIQDIKDFAGCFFITGANLDNSAPVMAYLLQEAVQRRKVATIVVDPRQIDFTVKERARLWLQIRPGTDIALYNGIANIILTEGLHNEAFLNASVEGFADWKTQLAEYTPERTSEITGISVEKLRQAAILYATGGAGLNGRNKNTNQFPASAIIYGTGVTQWESGVANVNALANLALLTGNFGRPGAGLNGVRDQANDQGASDQGCLPDYLPGYAPVSSAEARAALETSWFGRANGTIPTTPGLSYMEMFAAAEQGQIKAMYIMGENPMLGAPDLTLVRRGLERLDFLIVQDLFMTETARFADIILPAAGHAEKEGTFTNTERRIQRIKKAIASPGLARPDWKILADILHRPGFKSDYKNPAEIMAEITKANRFYAGVAYNKLDRGKPYQTYKPGLVYNQLAPMVMERAGLQWPVSASGEDTPILFTNGFATPSGKAKLVATKWQPSGNIPNGKFPLGLLIGRALWSQDRSGTMARRNHVLAALDPEPELVLNPSDAQRYGIVNGDIVRVSSAYGALEIKAQISPAQPTGLAFAPGGFREAPVNALLGVPAGLRSGTPAIKLVPVELERLRSSVRGLVTAGAGLDVVPAS